MVFPQFRGLKPAGKQWWLHKSTHCFHGGWNPRVSFIIIHISCQNLMEQKKTMFFFLRTLRILIQTTMEKHQVSTLRPIVTPHDDNLQGVSLDEWFSTSHPHNARLLKGEIPWILDILYLPGSKREISRKKHET